MSRFISWLIVTFLALLAACNADRWHLGIERGFGDYDGSGLSDLERDDVSVTAGLSGPIGRPLEAKRPCGDPWERPRPPEPSAPPPAEPEADEPLLSYEDRCASLDAPPVCALEHERHTTSELWCGALVIALSGVLIGIGATIGWLNRQT